MLLTSVVTTTIFFHLRLFQCIHAILKHYFTRNCALDETCVLCAKCFRSTDHQGHSSSFHVSRGGGGCCDCGDEEAWRTPLKCKYHSKDAIDDAGQREDGRELQQLGQPMHVEMLEKEKERDGVMLENQEEELNQVRSGFFSSLITFFN